MALTESIEYDKIEVIGQYKHVQVRKATVIKKDGAELTRSFERYVLHPDSNIISEPNEVRAVCNAVWTQEVKDAWKAYQESVYRSLQHKNPFFTSPYSRCSLISTFGRTSARFTKTRRYKGGANRRKPTTKNTLSTLT